MEQVTAGQFFALFVLPLIGAGAYVAWYWYNSRKDGKNV